MTILHAVILGIVEGVTEFLPISSTAHLLFITKILHISQNEFTTFFEVFIQSGAILAVVFLYYKKFLPKKILSKQGKLLITNLIVSFIPTAIIGFILHKTITQVLFRSTSMVLLIFFLMGFVFIVFEHYHMKKNLPLSISDITLKNAVLIGLFQATAIFPGVSRAGAVLLGMMFLGYNRKESAEYSFLLAIPTIFAAGALDFVKTDFTLIFQPDMILLTGVGFVTSFISALLVISWFIKFLQKNTLIPFGIYRIILAIILVTASVV